MRAGLCRAGTEFREDRAGQLLAKFHTILVKGIEAPKRAEGRDLVFVKCHQLAKGEGIKPGQQDRHAWPIARENPMRQKPRDLGLIYTGGAHFSGDGGGILAGEQRFGLCQTIGE